MSYAQERKQLHTALQQHLPAADPLQNPAAAGTGVFHQRNGATGTLVLGYTGPDGAKRSYSVNDDGDAVAVTTVEAGAMVTVVYRDGVEQHRQRKGPPEHN